LHRGGATICMVTHDPHYAHCAERTVNLLDGRLVGASVQAQASGIGIDQ
jgi:putative ABC transport system ATP-binding protein